MWTKTTRIIVLSFLLIVTLCEGLNESAHAAPNNVTVPLLSLSGGPSTTTVVKTVHHFKGIVVVKSSLSEANRRKDLLKSVRAIEDRGFMHTKADCDKQHKCAKWADRLTKKRYRYIYKRCLRRLKRCYRRARYWQKRRERIVTAAVKAEKATGVDATLLIALGRMESDFRPLQLIDARCGMRLRFGGRRACGADCGITQHRLYGKAKYVRRMCKKYARDYNLVFLKSAQEIARHIIYCRSKSSKSYHHPLRRCVLNRYNQGTFYKTKSRCNSYHRCSRMMQSHFVDKDLWYRAYKSCRKARRKCRNIAAYWIKLSCFEYGARNKIQSKRSCRRCYSYKSIKKFYPVPSTSKKPLQISSR